MNIQNDELGKQIIKVQLIANFNSHDDIFKEIWKQFSLVPGATIQKIYSSGASEHKEIKTVQKTEKNCNGKVVCLQMRFLFYFKTQENYF